MRRIVIVVVAVLFLLALALQTSIAMAAPRYGIAEDEATGAAAVRLVSQLGRPLVIRQGTGSLLRARPGPGGGARLRGHSRRERTTFSSAASRVTVEAR